MIWDSFAQPVENFCGKVELLKILGSLKKSVYFAEFRFFCQKGLTSTPVCQFPSSFADALSDVPARLPFSN